MMKAKLKHNDVFSLPDDRRVMMTVGEIKESFRAEYQRRTDEIFEQCKNDIVPQLMATCLSELNTEFGFGKDRLQRFKDGVEALFIQMASGGIMGREFTPRDCIEVIREKYGIDVEVKDDE